jgi:hypothetical protein
MEAARISVGRWGKARPLLLCLSILAPHLAAGLCVGEEASLEYEVKAAFLVNFARFVDWPPTAFVDSQSQMEICLVGKDRFGHVIDDLVRGESVNGRKLLVRRLDTVPDPQSCQIVFVNPEVKELKDILAALGPGVLTVSEGDGFIDDGGMIAFVLHNRRVRFDINQTAAEGHALKLSSKLLGVARSVTR